MSIFNYTICIKPPSKGGWSRKQLNEYAQSLGIDYKQYKTKQLLCEYLRDNQSTNQSTNPSTNQSTNQSTNSVTNQSTNPSTNASTNASTNPSTNPSTNASTTNSSTNTEIADILSKVAKQLIRENAKSGDLHRGKTIAKGAEIIRSLPDEIIDVSKLAKIKGIGNGIIRRVKEILETGTLNDLKEDIYDFTQIVGFGPSHHQSLHSKSIASLDELLIAINNNEYNPTNLQKVGIKYMEDFKQRIPRSEITDISDIIFKEINQIDTKIIATVVGSYRRGAVSSGDIDILITSPNNSNNLKILIDRLQQIKLIEDILSLGEVKFMGTYRSQYPNKQSEYDIRRKIDIRYVPYKSYPSALLHSTGSAKLNVTMRQLAIDKGLSLSEHGLRNVKTDTYLDIKTEQDIFKKLQIDYLQPVNRDI